MQALVGEVHGHVHKLPAGVGQAVGHDGLELFRQIGQIAGQRIAHLEGPAQLTCPLFQHRGQVLPGMVTPREERGDPMLAEDGHDARGEHTRAVRTARPVGTVRVSAPTAQRQDLRPRVVPGSSCLAGLVQHPASTWRVVSVVAPKSNCLSRWTETRLFSNSAVKYTSVSTAACNLTYSSSLIGVVVARSRVDSNSLWLISIRSVELGA